jgi:hypothetical protein
MMKKTLASLLLAATVMACSPSAPVSEGPLPAAAVRHVVVFKYRPAATQAQIGEVTDAFRALQTRIPGILAFEHGINNSPEGKNLGFTHVYTLTFADAAARDRYLPHPAHAEFGQLLGRLGVLEDAFVVDYVPGR